MDIVARLIIRNRNENKFYKDGKKKSPNWEYSFEIASIDKKRKRISKAGFSTKAEANKAGVIALSQYEQGGGTIQPSEMSCHDFWNIWLDNYVKIYCKETTYHNYQKKIRLYLDPYMGYYRLSTITPQICSETLNTLFNMGLSRNTLLVIKGILTSSFRYAVTPMCYLMHSPMVDIKLPGKRATPEKPQNNKPHIYIKKEEFQKIIERFPEGTTAHLPLMLGYYCGLRLGEVFGLLWQDIDFKKKTLRVERQVQNLSARVWSFKEPKYDSYRTITINQILCDLLKRTLQKQQQEKEKYFEYYKRIYVENRNRKEEHDIVSGIISETNGELIQPIMRRENGEYLTPDILKHATRVITGKFKEGKDPVLCENFDFHSLRHTHATILVEQGVPLAYIKQRLGHINLDITQIYTDHVSEDMEKNANAIITKL